MMQTNGHVAEPGGERYNQNDLSFRLHSLACIRNCHGPHTLTWLWEHLWNQGSDWHPPTNSLWLLPIHAEPAPQPEIIRMSHLLPGFQSGTKSTDTLATFGKVQLDAHLSSHHLNEILEFLPLWQFLHHPSSESRIHLFTLEASFESISSHLSGIPVVH